MKSKFLVTCSVLLLAVSVVMCGIEFVKHERRQSDRIACLEGDLSLLQEELKMVNRPPEISYHDDTYNYLAIGNSITKHDLCDYWWNEVGCAASSEDKDFYHIVLAYLQEQHNSVCSYAYNFNAWEVQATDRAETLTLLDQYLDPRLNLITLQLSENVTNTATFEADFLELIEYIKEKAPYAQIIIIDDFWDAGYKSDIKEEVAIVADVSFVSLDEIKGDDAYRCGLGTTVYDENGHPHIVEHEGVAIHPNDLAMEYIANSVISFIC